jgi:hypothetical protein
MSKFNSLLEYYYGIIKEQDVDAVEPNQSPPPQLPPSDVKPNSVSTGYASIVNLLFSLLKQSTKNINQKYYKLSDNEITNSNEAYRYLEIFSKLLPLNTKSEIENDNLGNETTDQKTIELNDSKIVEMANIAVKSLFYPDKDSIEFLNKVDEIQSILNKNGGNVSVNNADVVFQEIKNFVSIPE